MRNDNENNSKGFKGLKRSQMQLLIAATIAILTIGILVGATTAWLALNRKLQAEQMQMQVTTTSNLIIAKNTTDLSKKEFKVDFATPTPANLSPVTRTPSSYAGTDPDPYHLSYNNAPGKVSFDHGTGIADTDLKPVQEGQESLYFVDYTVYIAAYGKDFTNQDLTATVKLSNIADDKIQDYMQAASIDFYINNATTPIATLVPIDGKNVNQILTNGTIPSSENPNNAIQVTMRCYFDGALLMDENAADKVTFVRSEDLATDAFALNVEFEATDAEPTP